MDRVDAAGSAAGETIDVDSPVSMTGAGSAVEGNEVTVMVVVPLPERHIVVTGGILGGRVLLDNKRTECERQLCALASRITTWNTGQYIWICSRW